MAIYLWTLLIFALNPSLVMNDSVPDPSHFSTGTSSRRVVILDVNDAYLFQEFGWVYQYLTRRERVALAITKASK